jgi:hypothetical protein
LSSLSVDFAIQVIVVHSLNMGTMLFHADDSNLYASCYFWRVGMVDHNIGFFAPRPNVNEDHVNRLADMASYPTTHSGYAGGQPASVTGISPAGGTV